MKLSNEKHRDPLNSEMRERYHKTLNDYKKLLDTKKTGFHKEKTTQLDEEAKKLKNKKSPFVDKIRNEMIKASLEPLMLVYVKLFNLILQSGKMPDVWCQGLITPIHKTDDKSDPTNYRVTCVSSCLGKLFCSILNRRLHLYFEENKMLHNTQIGFLPENRSADHVFTLRTLMDKYGHYHKE